MAVPPELALQFGIVPQETNPPGPTWTAPGPRMVPGTTLTVPQVLPLIHKYEDANKGSGALNYAYDKTHTASGDYQITDTLWKEWAPKVGIDISKYPTAGSAPGLDTSAQQEDLQSKVAAAIVSSKGLTDWQGNAPLMSAVSQGGLAPGDTHAFGAGAPQADVTGLETRLNELTEKETRMEADIDRRARVRDLAEEAEKAPLEIGIQDDWWQMKQIRNQFIADKKDLPEWKPEPVMSGKDFEGFALALLAMALTGGIRGGQAWMRAANAFQGSMEGYLAGEKEVTQRRWDEFQQQYRKALQTQQEQIRTYEDAMRDKQLSIGEKQRQIGLIASRFQHEDIRMEAEERHSLDGIEKQISAMRTSIANTQAKNASLQIRYEQALARLQASNHAVKLLPEAEEVAAQLEIITGGAGATGRLLSQIYSRFAREGAVPIFNRMYFDEKQAHPNWTAHDIALDLAQDAAKTTALTSALRFNTVRQTGIWEITQAISDVEPKLIALARQVVPTDKPWANASINDIRRKFGDQGIRELQNLINTVGRLYVRAITAPGSNAQLHAGSHELADELINADMSIGQIAGALEVMNLEIETTDRSLSKTSIRLLRTIDNTFPDPKGNYQPDVERRLEGGEGGFKPKEWDELGVAPPDAEGIKGIVTP